MWVWGGTSLLSVNLQLSLFKVGPFSPIVFHFVPRAATPRQQKSPSQQPITLTFLCSEHPPPQPIERLSSHKADANTVMITSCLGRGLISLCGRQFATGKIAASCCWPNTGHLQNKSISGPRGGQSREVKRGGRPWALL